jgi:hypothetical protein
MNSQTATAALRRWLMLGLWLNDFHAAKIETGNEVPMGKTTLEQS